uniref:SFRICE_026836 n=1 Tax=Spodoptera frugiperda TaxID=7108 RepID=A0A2H1WLC7_SPOFR
MVIPYKGIKAGSRRQYNPNKPSKWGFKNLVRAGVSGIIYDFLLYGGDDTFRGKESLGVGGKIVLALCKTIRIQACSVYFDNYFTSLELLYILRENYGIFSLGTVRKNRLKDAELVCNENKLSVVKWFDNKHVRLVSSYVDAFPLEKIKRFSKKSKSRVDVSCPQIVKHYNRHCVHLADMLIALYRTSIKSY